MRERPTKGKKWLIFKGFAWSVLTIFVAIFVAIFVDFLVTLSSYGTINFPELITTSFNPYRIFEVSIILLSALIVEQFFSKFDSKLDTYFAVFQCFALALITILFSLHTGTHLLKPKHYEELLKKGCDLNYTCTDCNARLDTAIGTYKDELLTQRRIAQDSLNAYWIQAKSMQGRNGIKKPCPCLSYSLIALLFVFGLSIYFRTRMLLNEYS